MSRVAGLLIAGALFLAPTRAIACSCAATKPPQEAVNAADAVFRGVIVAVERAEPAWRRSMRAAGCSLKHLLGGQAADACMFEADEARHWENYGFVATFRVTSVWKGAQLRELRVRSHEPGGGSCGLGWAVGDEWVIYANGPGLLSTSGCSRSAYSEHASEESRLLGKPRISFE